MVRWTSVLLVMWVGLASVAAEDAESVPLGEYLVSAKLPEGYSTTSKDSMKDGKLIATYIFVGKGDLPSKVVVQIEMTDRSIEPARRAAAKGYVNGFASALSNVGLRLVEKQTTDFDKETFEKPVSVGLNFVNREGKKIFTRQEIFFTDKGFAIQVISDDPETMETLTKWAKSVKPKPAA